MPLDVHGMPVVFGNVDLEGDVIVKGAFSNWIAENKNKPVKIFWMHSHQFDPTAKPIGVATQIAQTSKGVVIKKGRILDTAEGLEVQTLLKGGALVEASFGFRKRPNGAQQRKGVRYLTDLDLTEFTVANWGVNSKAWIGAVEDSEESNDEDRT
jgi:HK97 family phage prohead protease